MAGTSVAAALASTAKVARLEAESQPGFHTTGRSAALFAPNYGSPLFRALTRASAPGDSDHGDHHRPGHQPRYGQRCVLAACARALGRAAVATARARASPVAPIRAQNAGAPAGIVVGVAALRTRVFSVARRGTRGRSGGRLTHHARLR